MTYREILEGLIDRTKRPARRAQYERELEMPPFPDALKYLWNMYHRIRNRKGGNGFSANPIEFADIEAFLRLTHNTLEPWELQTIEQIDNAFIAAPAAAKSKSGAESDE